MTQGGKREGNKESQGGKQILAGASHDKNSGFVNFVLIYFASILTLPHICGTFDTISKVT